MFSNGRVSLQVGMFLKNLHESNGVKFHLGSSLVNLKGEDGKVQGAVLKNGVEIAVSASSLTIVC